MTSLEKWELVLITLFILLVYLCAPFLPMDIKVSSLLLYCSSLFLFQGLVRDLYHYFFINSADELESKRAQCICLESSIGILGILIGVLLVFTQIKSVVYLNSLIWTGLCSIVLINGFLLKDWVLYWNPMHLRREKNHMNVIFSIKK